MRGASILGGLTVVCLCAAQAGAQSYPYRATVKGSDVAVRSGPSFQHYATGLLHPGDPVTVLGTAPDDSRWLQIQPPPGSFSWIDINALSPDHLTVMRDDVPVYVGSTVYNQRPTVSWVRASKGQQVVPYPGPTMPYGNGITLINIGPLPREVRYIWAAAIQSANPVTVTSTPAPSTPAVGASLLPAQASARSATLDNLWAEAERADVNDPNHAIWIYDRLSHEETTESRRLEAGNRAEWLRRGYHGPFGNGLAQSAANAPAGSPYGSTASPYGRAASTTASANPSNGLQYTWTQENRRSNTASPVQTMAFTPTATTPAAPATPSTPVWSKIGSLRPAAFRLAGQTTFALVDSHGEPILYATAEPNVPLDRYLYTNVYLGGPMSYNGELRHNYMRVTAVQMAR